MAAAGPEVVGQRVVVWRDGSAGWGLLPAGSRPPPDGVPAPKVVHCSRGLYLRDVVFHLDEEGYARRPRPTVVAWAEGLILYIDVQEPPGGVPLAYRGTEDWPFRVGLDPCKRAGALFLGWHPLVWWHLQSG